VTTPIEAGPFSTAARNLARMLANSATWRGLVVDQIYPPDAEFGVFLRSADEQSSRPLAVISPADQTSFRLATGGSSNGLRQSGSIFLYLAIDIPAELANDPIAAEFHALDRFGNVLTEVVDQSAWDDLLAITSAQLVAYGPPDDTDIPSTGLFYFSAWTIAWGDGDN
jgi:hypothetical protein